MLYLLCVVGNDRFGIEANRVVEVLPLLHWKHVPKAQYGIVGLLNYHGTPVPVVDLSLLMLGTLAPRRMHTRIVLVRTYPDPASQEPTLLALVAERVRGSFRRSEEEFTAPDAAVLTAPYLGPVVSDEKEILQRLDVDRIVPLEARLHDPQMTQMHRIEVEGSTS